MLFCLKFEQSLLSNKLKYSMLMIVFYRNSTTNPATNVNERKKFDKYFTLLLTNYYHLCTKSMWSARTRTCFSSRPIESDYMRKINKYKRPSSSRWRLIQDSLLTCHVLNTTQVIPKLKHYLDSKIWIEDLNDSARYLGQIKLKTTERLQKELLHQRADKSQDLHNTTRLGEDAEH